MNNIIEFFYNLYENKEEIFNFVFSKKEHNFFKRNKEDIVINNSIYCFFQILKDNRLKTKKIGYSTTDGEYVI